MMFQKATVESGQQGVMSALEAAFAQACQKVLERLARVPAGSSSEWRATFAAHERLLRLTRNEAEALVCEPACRISSFPPRNSTRA